MNKFTNNQKQSGGNMANDWNRLNQQFLKEYAITGITVKEWCKKSNLNYDTARRYIKPNAQNSQSTTRKIHRAQNEKNAQKKLTLNNDSLKNQVVNDVKVDGLANSHSLKIVPSKKRVASIGNQKVNHFEHYGVFIATYEDALQYQSALKESYREKHKNLTLLQMQRSDLMVKIERVENELDKNKLDGYLTHEQSFSLFEEYLALDIILVDKSDQIVSLINVLLSQERRIAEILKCIALTELQVAKLKLLN
jgi:hypothetical protein